MLCYKGRTFCSQECANTACSRNLTESIMADARRWWIGNGDPPIDIANLKTDSCGYLPKEKL